MPDGINSLIAEPIQLLNQQMLLYQIGFDAYPLYAGVDIYMMPIHNEFGRGIPRQITQPTNGGYVAPSKLLSFVMRSPILPNHLVQITIQEAALWCTPASGLRVTTAVHYVVTGHAKFNHRAYQEYVWINLLNINAPGQDILTGEIKIFSEAGK